MISLLPLYLQNQIAAGEVVERPASVVKELVENAIDAGANDIQVQIENGGFTEIRIIDNGKGMNEKDAQMSFQRYATSKISTADDLFTLQTFGFRGEAIAAIASVSDYTIRTKQKNTLYGTEIINGENPKPIGCQEGTEVIVQNLFWNVPARKKFLKSEETESREITKIMEQFALSHPNVSFRLLNNKKIIFDLIASKNENPFLIRAKKVLGENISSFFLPLQYNGTEIYAEGFCSHPSLHRSTKEKQFFFVNGRMITKDSIFSACIIQAYQSLLPNGKYPVVIFSLTIPPDQVDVNVHPRKLEVKFSQPSQIFQIIKGAIESALSQKYINQTESTDFQNPSSHFSKPLIHTFSSPTSSAYSFQNSFKSHSASQKNTILQPHFFESIEHENTQSWKVIGQARNSFIIVEEANGIRIIDQHAAHERIRYEKLLNDSKNKKIEMQPLLTPCILSFTPSEKSLILEHLSELLEYGFEIEDFGGNDVTVLSVPSGSEHISLENLFGALLADLDFFDPSFGKTLKNPIEKIISYTACRGSKKFGDKMTKEEMEALVKDWKACNTKDACAHGRPVSTFLYFKDIENECGRY